MEVLQYFVWIVVIAAASHVNCMSNETEHRRILNFIEKCEAELVFGDEYKNVVLVLGNTGAGKTTFTQWIAGDDSKLISIEVLESGEYIIVDDGKISNTTIESKTIFPELVVDKETGTAYYDISGFSDTRGTEHDISTSYFIKRIIDHVDSIKVLLVVSHSSVRKGVDRLDFIRLIRHFTDLVSNIERYINGIGLVVTKVENNYRKNSKGELSLVGDDAVVSSIAAFLLEVVENLKHNKESSTATAADKLFCDKAISVINSLVFSETNSYEKIVLFRRPDQLGPLNKIEHLRQAKLIVRHMVSKNLQFVPKNSDDFRYTVSDETKNKLNILLKDIEKSLEDNVKAIATHMYNHYESMLKDINLKIINEGDNPNDLDRIDSKLREIKNVTETVDAAIHDILELASNLNDIESSQMIPNTINNTINRLDVDIPKWIMLDISSVAHFLDFLETTSIIKYKLNIPPLKLPFLEVATQLVQFCVTVKEKYTKLVEDLENTIKSNIKISIEKLKDQFSKYEKDVFDIKELSERMNKFYDEFLKFNLSDSNTTLIKINQDFILYDITLKPGIQKKIREDVKYYLYFKNEMENLISYLRDSQNWYRFLNLLYNKLSSYEIQKDKETKRHCSSFVQNTITKQLYVGKKVNDTNIEFLLRECYNDLYEEEYKEVKEVYLNQNNVKLLQDVIKSTLDDTFSQICNDSKLVVKDRFVRLSAINFNDCASMTSLEILSSEKVFVDKDLDFTGRNIQMAVMGPTWEIIGLRKIVLNGLPGEQIWPSKADEEVQGLPGNPGGNAGDFLGFGDHFINGDNLYIFANGGDGSSGQDGGDGKPGYDANSPRVIDKNDLSCNYIIVYCSDYTESTGDCSNGGDGQFGGQGGKGGKAGKVEVFSAPFKVVTEDGNEGAEGSIGSSGRAGRPAEVKKVTEKKLWLLFGSISLSTKTNRNVIRCKPGGIASPQDDYFSRSVVPPKSEFEFEPYFYEFYDHLEHSLETTMNRNVLDESISSVSHTLDSLSTNLQVRDLEEASE